MKTTDLSYALKLCKSSLLSIDFVPILTHFCFTGDTVFSYNDISAVVVPLETGLTLGIKGETLLGVLSTLGAEVELVGNKDNTSIKLVSGKAKVDLATMPPEAFLFEAPSEEPVLHVLCNAEVLKGLARCVATVGANALHREFTGVTFVLAQDGGVDVYSTDDTRLSHFHIDAEFVNTETTPSGKGQWLLPAQTVRQLIDVNNATKDEQGAETPVLSLCENWLVFEASGATVISKLMPEAPPDYAAMLGHVAPPSSAWQPLPVALTVAFRRAEVLNYKEAYPRLSLVSKGTSLKLEVEKGTAQGSFTEDFKLPKSSGDVSMQVDPGKAREASEVASSFALHERCLGFQDASGYRCLVAPLKSAEE